MVGLAVLTAALVVASLLLLTSFLLGHATDNQTRALARTRADAVAATVVVGDGQVSLTEGSSGEDRFDAVAWAYADGRLVDGSVPSEVAGDATRLSTATHDVYTQTDHYLLYAQPVPTPGHQVTVVVMVDLAPYTDSERRSLFASLALGGLAIVLAGLIADVVVRRALGVVHRMSALADDWSNKSSDRRFALESRDEFGELARTLDRLLDRVAHAIADERRLTDEIAHELRTPLSVLRAETQLAELTGNLVEPERVLTEVDRLSTAVTAILDAARSRLGGGAACDVASALRLAAEGPDVDVSAPTDIAVAVPSEVVTSVLAPLLANAARHARSTVRIAADVEGDVVVVHVLDDGPGFAPQDTERVFEPGSTGGEGHGLGLAVARRIATATGLELRAVADGRGHVQVRLPRA
jgi:signal transduction histidine kinase